MKVPSLAFCCNLYSSVTNYDDSYIVFLKATNPAPNLDLEDHRVLLLGWLNKWGCRQFAKKYHNLASEEIRTWYQEFKSTAFPREKVLLDLSEKEIEFASQSYERLTERQASKRKMRSGNLSTISIGPTGAAKILFAIRPNALMPWDDSIRKGLGFDGSARSYAEHLRKARAELEELSECCERNRYRLADLPSLVGRPTSSLPKLIDEYYYITLTKKYPPPGEESLRQWASWK